MRLLIFGSTGSIGQQLVEQALDQGHSVTAFARSPVKFELVNHSNFRIFQGDVLDMASVRKAVEGQEAVFCALGAGRKGRVRSEGTQNIIRAMEQVGVNRFICQTTLGAGESWGNLDFFWKYIMFGFFLRDAFADHERQEEYVRQSRLDWTLIRPAAFTDGNRRGQYRHGFAESARDLKLKISRADVADFMLKQLANDAYRHQAPGISY